MPTNGATIVANTSFTATGNVAGRNGGVAEAHNGPISINATGTGSTTISGNSAAGLGGAISTDISTVAGISDDVIIGNANGGAVVITNNSATGATSTGGAIDSGNNTTLASGSQITLSGNTATLDGGGVHTVGLTVTGPLTASNNTSTSGNGGALFVAAGGVNSAATTIMSGNTAGLSGGAIYAAAGNVSLATLAGANATLSGNRAGAVGGAINVVNGSVTIGNSTANVSISGNSAGTNGGAIFAQTVNVTGTGVISGNSAGGKGGAIYLAPGGSLSLGAPNGDLTFSGNTHGTTATPQANAIYVAGTSSLVFNADRTISFRDPIAGGTALVTVTKNGPGMVSFNGADYSTVANQQSTIYATTQVNQGTFEVANNAIYGEHAAAVGGAAPSTFTMAPGTTLQGGVAGTVITDQFTLGSNATLSIAGSQPQTRGVFTIDSGTINFGGGSQVLFNTFLNNAAVQNSDVLVFANATSINGQALAMVNNVGGPGGLTLNDGILIVRSVGGTFPSASAFRLGSVVEAGAFEYLLFHGDVLGTPANAGNYYLRSGLIIVPGQPPVIPPASLPPVLDFLGDQVAGGAAGAIPVVVQTAEGPKTLELVPFFRPAAAVYAAIPGVARQMGLQILGTFHDRAGEQSLVNGNGPNGDGLLPAGWVRGFGRTLNQSWTGTNEPRFDGSIFGFQAGFDVFRFESFPGHRDYIGLFAGYTGADGDVSGRLIGPLAFRAGSLPMNAAHVGAYWTHIGPGEWYVDTVLLGSFYDGKAETITGNRANLGGNGFTASVEAGLPIPLNATWRIEPQVQVIYQSLGLNQTNDTISTVKFHTTDSVTLRGGVRLQDTIALTGGQVLQPYGRLNLWHTVGATDRIILGTDTVTAGQAATSLEVQAGLVVKWNQNLAFWGNISVATSVTSQRYNSVGGTVGLRYTFGEPPPPMPVTPTAAQGPAASRTYLVFFDWDRADLTGRARQIIADAAAASTRVQTTRIEVNGHTDTSGTVAYNQTLSVRRAQAVADELVRNGVARSEIAVRGFGQSGLLVQTGPGVREPQNRRVEIILL